jgi:RNA polymerase sigma-70 factor, ECF subfamily
LLLRPAEAAAPHLTRRAFAASDHPVRRIFGGPTRAEPGPQDAELIASAAAGSEQARDQLVRLYLRDVYEATSRVLTDRQLAEDAAQDAFINALNNLHRFRGESSFRTWLLRIAVNAAHSVARRQGSRREIALSAADDLADGVDVEREALAQSEAERVRQLVGRLPPKQRLAVTLRVHQGLSYGEIAGVLNCTEGAARVNYHLGVKRLKEWIQ